MRQLVLAYVVLAEWKVNPTPNIRTLGHQVPNWAQFQPKGMINPRAKTGSIGDQVTDPRISHLRGLDITHYNPYLDTKTNVKIAEYLERTPLDLSEEQGGDKGDQWAKDDAGHFYKVKDYESEVEEEMHQKARQFSEKWKAKGKKLAMAKYRTSAQKIEDSIQESFDRATPVNGGSRHFHAALAQAQADAAAEAGAADVDPKKFEYRENYPVLGPYVNPERADPTITVPGQSNVEEWTEIGMMVHEALIQFGFRTSLTTVIVTALMQCL